MNSELTLRDTPKDSGRYFETKTKYMTFRLVGRKPKTQVWHVLNNSSGLLLGSIEWYIPWRQYTFQSSGHNCIFNTGCLLTIKEFLDRLNTEQRK